MIQTPPQAHSRAAARPDTEWSKDSGHPRPDESHGNIRQSTWSANVCVALFTGNSNRKTCISYHQF